MTVLNTVACPDAVAERLHPASLAEEREPRRPRVVALGGGTGLPVLLRSLKSRLYRGSVAGAETEEPEEKGLTAIVTVTDDGGSSGRLRRDLNILPPGDIRNCLSALSDNGALSSDLLQYRFKKGNGLSGHNMGNLLLAALTDLKGDFAEAVECCSRIMNIRGQVLPSTRTNVSLAARFTDGRIVRGESAIVEYGGRIARVFLHPRRTETQASAIRAIENADAIIMGPGSLFTSVIPNLLVKDVAAAIKRSAAKKIYVCNLMTEPGETDGFSASDHIRAIFDHTDHNFFEYVILNNGTVPAGVRQKYALQGFHPVRPDLETIKDLGVAVAEADVISGEGGRIRHNENRLGQLLMALMRVSCLPV